MTTKEFLKELLTTYWSQVTLFLAFFGYFAKRILDNISKKSEINHNLFQQKRLESVISYFSAYAKTEQMWTGIAIWDILNGKIDVKGIDEIIFPNLNELKSKTLELQIYFTDYEYKYFAEILKNIYQINSKLSKIYFDFEPDKSTTNKSNEFQFFREQKLEENELILKKITEIIKNTFK